MSGNIKGLANGIPLARDVGLQLRLNRLKYMKEWRERNKEHVKAYAKRTYPKHREYTKNWRKENKERDKKWRSENYQKNKEKKRKKARDFYYKHKSRLRTKTNQIRKMWNQNHPLQCKAVNEANKKIKLLKEDKCSICQSQKNLEKHHPDYNKSLIIIILCRNCHRELHRLIEQELSLKEKSKEV